MKHTTTLTLALFLCVPCYLGCDAGSVSKNKPAASHDHDHDHDHDHGHGEPAKAKADEHAGHSHSEHGPNGGHVAHFDTNPTTHFEWAHDDDNHLLTVYFENLVSAGAKIEAVEVVITSGGEEKKYTLAPLDSAKIAGSVFQAKDQEMLTLVGASGDDEKGVQARLYVTIDGKKESLLLKDDHHHH